MHMVLLSQNEQLWPLNRRTIKIHDLARSTKPSQFSSPNVKNFESVEMENFNCT